MRQAGNIRTFAARELRLLLVLNTESDYAL
jgi:hypothetical protein